MDEIWFYSIKYLFWGIYSDKTPFSVHSDTFWMPLPGIKSTASSMVLNDIKTSEEPQTHGQESSFVREVYVRGDSSAETEEKITAQQAAVHDNT